ncbi:MAG TPA: orotidine-5'-phosphate decarboxylase [Candidatus Altiarchaeales archaeon]|nr:orotidine-5'-phosphate decarboxylase [Candidatus Altiarchaeales archaeon]
MEGQSGRLEMIFLEKYLKAREEKDSVLCVGLDPAVKGQRKENTIEADGSDSRGILEFCLEVVENVSEHCCAVKPNSQYLLFALEQKHLKKLNRSIHGQGLVSILDHKLSDIGSSNDSAVYWIGECGFDAFTYSPYPGNIAETIKSAGESGLGVFTLCLMSNSEAKWIQKETVFDKNPLFLQVAEIVAYAGGEGIVVGAAGSVTKDDVKVLRDTTGEDMIYLHPGIGAQGGDLEGIISLPGNVLVNVGRDIIYSEDASKKCGEYNLKINNILKQ